MELDSVLKQPASGYHPSCSEGQGDICPLKKEGCTCFRFKNSPWDWKEGRYKECTTYKNRYPPDSV